MLLAVRRRHGDHERVVIAQRFHEAGIPRKKAHRPGRGGPSLVQLHSADELGVALSLYQAGRIARDRDLLVALGVTVLSLGRHHQPRRGGQMGHPQRHQRAAQYA
jgi:hypothetical protein